MSHSKESNTRKPEASSLRSKEEELQQQLSATPDFNPFALDDNAWEADFAELEAGAEELPRETVPMNSRPGISLLTGILTETATPEEQARWKELQRSHPEAGQELQLLQDFVDEPDGMLSFEEHLQRGEALQAQLEPLPQDFWQQLEESYSSTVEASPTAFEQGASPMEMAETVSFEEEEPALSEPETEPSTTSSFWQQPWSWGVSGVVALAAFLVFVLPALNQQTGQKDDGSGKSPSKILSIGPLKTRMMGTRRSTPPTHPDQKSLTPAGDSFVFQVERKRGQKITLLEKKTAFIQRGDELRFRYRAKFEGKRYLLLFQWDEKGEMSRLYPGHSHRFALTASAGLRYLKGGALQAPATRYERLYVCVSKTYISYEQVQQWLTQQRKRRNLQKLQKLGVNCQFQTSWLLQWKQP